MLRQPESMDECVYFTRRAIGNGHAMAWVFKEECPQCHNAKIGKPVEKGKVKIRATEYVCPSCGYKEEKEEHEEKLTMNIAYTCPHCAHQGETQVPFIRKTFQGVKAVVFECENCHEKIPVTKKMADPKKKK
jgi:predicted RNA-binding Zn-ribbon protein involved in translation (DUF1610 family)